jgi:hypothetical protein
MNLSPFKFRGQNHYVQGWTEVMNHLFGGKPI